MKAQHCLFTRYISFEDVNFLPKICIPNLVSSILKLNNPYNHFHRRNLHKIASLGHFIQLRSNWFGPPLPFGWQWTLWKVRIRKKTKLMQCYNAQWMLLYDFFQKNTNLFESWLFLSWWLLQTRKLVIIRLDLIQNGESEI